ITSLPSQLSYFCSISIPVHSLSLYLFCSIFFSFFFFFNDTATTEIYTLSLHDALPIWKSIRCCCAICSAGRLCWCARTSCRWPRSEEHTSELQSQSNLVCRLLLEKKKKKT